MRQAGRYLPEYMAVREQVDFLTLCRTPELAAKVTLQPIDRFGLDAAILFSDILIPAEPMGFGVRFEPGPVIDAPVRTRADVERVRLFEPRDEVPFVFDTIRILRRELEGRVPLIGFAATPFTLSAYLVEGSGSKTFDRIKGLLFSDAPTAHLLLEKVADVTQRYLAAQIEAGAQAIQLFDSWAGLLGLDEYREFSLTYVRRVFEHLRPSGVPLIYFALNGSHLLEAIRECGADVVGVDWRLPLDQASARLQNRFTLQGNLDPCLLLAPPPVIEKQARYIVELGSALPGHVFNLGHGILPDTPVESVETLVRCVQERDSAA